HRAADVEQQHEARAHAAAILPAEAERHSSTLDAAAYRPAHVEATTHSSARLSSQPEVLQATSEASHQRFDVANVIGMMKVTEVRGRHRPLATCSVSRG